MVGGTGLEARHLVSVQVPTAVEVCSISLLRGGPEVYWPATILRVGSPRKQSVKVRRWRATARQETRDDTSYHRLDLWLNQRAPTKKDRSIKAVSIVVEDYELKMELRPKAGEDPADPESWSGVRLYEKVFSLGGTESVDEKIDQVEERLRCDASARRLNSYRRLVLYLTPDILKSQVPSDMPKTAKEFARQVVAQFGDELDAAHDRDAERERIRSLVTVRELHRLASEADLQDGRIAPGTKAAAPSFASPWLSKFGGRRIDQVSADDISEWFNAELAKPGGSTKRLKNALGELSRIHKYIRRKKKHQEFASTFDVRDLRLHLDGVVRPADGASGKKPFTVEQVERLFRAAQTDEERAVLALAFTGVRTLGEVAAARWDSFTQELGSWWMQVNWTVVDLDGGKYILEPPKDVKSRSRQGKKVVRHVPIPQRLWEWIEPMRSNRDFVFKVVDDVPSNRRVERIMNRLIDRAGIREKGLSPYSVRHTVLDRVDELAGRTYRNLMHRGDDDPSIANRVYTHADATRFRKRMLMRKGRTCADVLPWASPDFGRPKESR